MSEYLHKKPLTSFQIIIFGFGMVILIGTCLLMLPYSTRNGEGASFLEALFTATSAVCVTGLVVQDTATYWSEIGQAIILLLIQIGGMGVITVAAGVSLVSGRRISLMQRSTMQEAIAAPQVGGIVKLTGFIIKGTFLFEFLGAIAMMPVFYADFGWNGIWMAVFHSISAFCNAGFDLLGRNAQFSSLISYANHPVINLVIMLLIIIGGIGFLTWEDIYVHKQKVQKYRMQTKVVLVMTVILIAVPAVYFFCMEFQNLPWKERVLASFFQAVTPRTAGFNTIDFLSLSEAGIGIIILLMLIGGSPGSTAGGMKVTTIAVLAANTKAVFRRKTETNIFGRRVADDTIKTAATILLMYVTLFFGAAVIISILEGLPMLTCLFETASAIATVGLTLGVTPGLGGVSRFILILLMFFGRVGGLTLIFAATSGINKNYAKMPQGKITVG